MCVVRGLEALIVDPGVPSVREIKAACLLSTVRKRPNSLSDDLLAPDDKHSSNSDFWVADQRLERQEPPRVVVQVQEPPVPLPTFVQHRHTCIQSIRQRHQDTFGSLLMDDSTQTTIPTTGHLLIDPAYNKNFGDVMLTFGEQTFFKTAGLYVEECLYTRARPEILLPDCVPMMDFDDLSKSQSQKTKLALWHAGGN
jgi:hypothetical protein